MIVLSSFIGRASLDADPDETYTQAPRWRQPETKGLDMTDHVERAKTIDLQARALYQAATEPMKTTVP